FEPGLPSLSYLALRHADALTVATFFSPERLSYPPGRAQRARLLGRLDALHATSEATVEAAALRFPGTYELVPLGVDLARHAPGRKRKSVVVEWRQLERPLLRAVVRELAELARLLEDDAFRSRRSEEAAAAAAGASFAVLADRVEEVYGSITGRRRVQPPRATAPSDPDWIVADLHLHTSWSHDCSIEVDDL